MKKMLSIILTVLVLQTLTACAENNDVLTYESNPKWGIEELGETIIAAGTFWENWWNLNDMFADEHIEWIDWDELPEHITSERGFGFARLLPTSGLENLSDIRNHLLQFYTENWIDSELFGDFAAFIEYDGILYIDGTRAGFPRPDWKTAEHTLLDQDGSHAVVETTVLYGAWHMAPYVEVVPWEVQYRFIFVDGRIDNVLN